MSLLPQLAKYNATKQSGRRLVEDQTDAVEEWLGYFERTYIGALNWRTGVRRRPVYPHAFWNIREQVLANVPLTTNAADGFNAAMAVSLPRNCTIWTLVVQLRTEENINVIKLRYVALGLQNNSATAPNVGCEQRRQELKQLNSNYPNISLQLFMDSVVDFFNN